MKCKYMWQNISCGLSSSTIKWNFKSQSLTDSFQMSHYSGIYYCIRSETGSMAKSASVPWQRVNFGLHLSKITDRSDNSLCESPARLLWEEYQWSTEIGSSPCTSVAMFKEKQRELCGQHTGGMFGNKMAEFATLVKLTLYFLIV